MWSPTHVQVLVKRAKGLKVKGKEGTNDAFVTIGLGKEKFRTSTKEKSGDPVEWMEQCELLIPTQGNTAEVNLTVLHRNLIGVDEFLGQVSLPLKDFDIYERPKTRWHSLKCKAGQTKKDYRGELEVRIGFTVKASESVGGSTADLTKKTKGSLSSLNKVAGNIGGSLLSLGNKESRNIKKLMKSASHKVEKVGEKAKKSVSTLKLSKDRGTLDSVPETRQWSTLDRRLDENQDPGVNSDEEGDDMFKFDTLSQKSTASSLSMNRLGRVSNTSTPFSGSLEAFNVDTPPAFRQNNRNSLVTKPKEKDEWESKLFGKKAIAKTDANGPIKIPSKQYTIKEEIYSEPNATIADPSFNKKLAKSKLTLDLTPNTEIWKLKSEMKASQKLEALETFEDGDIVCDRKEMKLSLLQEKKNSFVISGSTIPFGEGSENELDTATDKKSDFTLDKEGKEGSDKRNCQDESILLKTDLHTLALNKLSKKSMPEIRLDKEEDTVLRSPFKWSKKSMPEIRLDREEDTTMQSQFSKKSMPNIGGFGSKNFHEDSIFKRSVNPDQPKQSTIEHSKDMPETRTEGQDGENTAAEYMHSPSSISPQTPKRKTSRLFKLSLSKSNLDLKGASLENAENYHKSLPKLSSKDKAVRGKISNDLTWTRQQSAEMFEERQKKMSSGESVMEVKSLGNLGNI